MKTKHGNTFKTTAIVCALMASISATPVMANEVSSTEVLSKEEQKNNENIGFGTGMVLGAIVAGPIGAFVSGMAGVFAAKHYNVTNERDILTVKLDDEKSQYQLAMERYQKKLHEAEMSYQQELIALQQNQHETTQLQAQNLLMSLQFSTGSSEIKPHYQDQITALAKLLKQSPDLSVDLSGYTDLQGSDEMNHALSIARVNSVKRALIGQGVEAERINLFAFGEQAPVVANNEKQVSFYDRRVVIKLQPNALNQINQQTVSNR